MSDLKQHLVTSIYPRHTSTTHIHQILNQTNGKLPLARKMNSSLTILELKDVRSEATSGYIHLSKAHIYNTYSPNSKSNQWEVAIGKKDEFIPDDIRIEGCPI